MEKKIDAGVFVPDDMIEEIASRIIQQLKPICQSVV